MPNGSYSGGSCNDANASPTCPGIGTQPYVTSVSEPLNYGAKVQYDSVKQLPYFIAMVIEWLDRYSSLFLYRQICRSCKPGKLCLLQTSPSPGGPAIKSSSFQEQVAGLKYPC